MRSEYTDLFEAARMARENAYAPYSGHKVGAALLGDDGRVFTGCNVECSSYGLTLCAERVALFKAVSEGVRAFRAMAVTTGDRRPCRLCGACRQALWDFAPQLLIVTEDEAGELREQPLAGLIPEAFGPSLLGGD